ncbi:hypothetical protein AJ80_05601 [Polytolypa hystricis UAMH7299]|uniref:Uncharacterized protein n=1 Tax=Polytolypa hystricis (strain UAMH7299) TaxID=1447883 RepID=A0A2B7Y334_POLH7|nr:hypothetical protein AJ80_05601 [Polytolypa hystricis UAMH7299]
MGINPPSEPHESLVWNSSNRSKSIFEVTFLSAIISCRRMITLTQDPRVPKDLTDEQKATIEHDPLLVELKYQRLEYRSISKACSTDPYAQLNKLEKSIQSERQYLRRQVQEEIREQFFTTIDTIEIEHQLLGLSVANHLKIEDTEEVHFTFIERHCLAQSLFQSLGGCADKKHDFHSQQVQAICDWAALCDLQGINHKKNVLSCEPTIPKEEPNLVDADKFPLICPATQCLFCLGNDQLAYNARIYSFSRTEHLLRYMHDYHLRYLALDAGFPCPDPSCSEDVQGVVH